MVSITSLWLPILLSAVIVFVASSVIHMVLSYHKNDLRSLPKEAEVMAALRPFNIPPGDYGMPRPASMKDMGTPEFAEKLKKGPAAFMTVLRPGPPETAAQLVQWFLYSVVISVFSWYVAEPCRWSERGLPDGLPLRRHDRVHGLRDGAAAVLHLVPPQLGHDAAIDVRRAPLCFAHGGDVRVAMATMRYLLILTQVEDAWEHAPPGQGDRVREQYDAIERELTARGKLIEAVRLRPRREARTLRNLSTDERILIHGPFADAREAMGGYYLIECHSMDEAIEWAKRMPNFGHGSVEVRPLDDA